MLGSVLHIDDNVETILEANRNGIHGMLVAVKPE
jgi:FMN phosphatase YigB (HAD superfamily)